MAIRIILVAILSLLTGCATDMALIPSKGQSKQVIFQDGNPAVLGYNKDQTIGIAVRPNSLNLSSNQRLKFYVVVANLRAEPFLFDPSTIKVETASGKALKVYSYEDMVAEIKRRRAWALLENAMSAFSRGYGGGQAGTTTYQGTANTYGTYNGIGRDDSLFHS